MSEFVHQQLRSYKDGAMGRLEEPGIEIGTAGYMGSGLSTTPCRLLLYQGIRIHTDFHTACFVFVALRPKSTAMVMVGRSGHLTTHFPGQA